MKTITTLSLTAITALFIGCGGGGSSSTTNNATSSVAGGSTSSTATLKNGGIFVDAPVQGLSYTCQASGTSGTTDATGRYDCAQDDTTVTFGIGSRNLGTTAIAEVITPKSFFNGANREDEILNLAQLLQTMDKDGNPDNGIELDETAILNWQSNHTGFDAANFDSEIANILGKALVSETAAREHMNNALAAFGISGIAGGTTSSAVVSSSSTGSSSSQASTGNSCADGCTSINSNDVAGYTIIAEWQSGTKVKNIKTVTYIFLEDNQAVAVTDYYDGSRRVARGSYHPYEDGHGLVSTIQSMYYDNGDSYIDAISGPNALTEITVGQSHNATNNIVTSIIPNADNGIDEATVASITVEAPEENENAPMRDELYGKTLSIYNGISTNLVNGMNSTFEYAGNTRYDSNVELHCTDYGYTETFVESSENGLDLKVYMFPGNSNLMCSESNYAAAAEHSGSRNAVWYKE